MKKKYEDNNYVIYYPDALEKFVNDMIICTKVQINNIYTFFNVKNLRKIQVNLFDNIDEFRKFVIDLRSGDEKSLPQYAKGTFDEGMINAYIESNLIKTSSLYERRKRMLLHETVHLIYNEILLMNNFDNRVVWLDEGLAQNLSLEEEKNDKKIKQSIISSNIVININDLSHGASFVTSEYNGYDLSYFAVRYLLDTLDSKQIIEIIKDKDKAIKLGKTIIIDAINFYKERI